jgi:hypothetical protein
MAIRDPREDQGDTTKAAILGGIAVLIAVAPFVTGANTGWIVLSLGLATMLGASAVMVGSGSNFDGPPPQRRG